MIGYFAVNPATAEVWSVNNCAPITSAAVAKLQARIRRRRGLTKELQGKQPTCG